jgi:hypothetical protein
MWVSNGSRFQTSADVRRKSAGKKENRGALPFEDGVSSFEHSVKNLGVLGVELADQGLMVTE